MTWATRGAAVPWKRTAFWLLPDTAVTSTGAPALPLARKVTGEPDSPAAVAVATLLLTPATVPMVQVVEASPCALVVTGAAAATAPPPAVTAKVTATPATGSPPASVTRTPIGVGSAVPTVPFCTLPDATAMVVAVCEGPLPSVAGAAEHEHRRHCRQPRPRHSAMHPHDALPRDSLAQGVGRAQGVTRR